MSSREQRGAFKRPQNRTAIEKLIFMRRQFIKWIRQATNVDFPIHKFQFDLSNEAYKFNLCRRYRRRHRIHKSSICGWSLDSR